MKYYLAIDLGASSGRHVVAYKENGKVVLDEVHRFKTGMDDTKNGLVWNIPKFVQDIKDGIRLAFLKYPVIESIAIDTWGVDYVLMNGDKEIKPFFAYRNERNKVAADEVHKVVPFDELYRHTGIQYAPFNTIYQLYADLKAGRLEKATDYLMLPSYFSYKLTGVKTHEYTEESTGAFLNAKSGTYDLELLDKLGLPSKLFGDIQKPGYVVGELLPEVQEEVGGNSTVILCASHDTGSAYESIESPEDAIILSSGTWSLFGIKSKEPISNEESLKANFTNEGGVGYIRFLKNIAGMWIANQVRENYNNIPFKYIDDNIYNSKYKETFDVNDESLAAPKNMKEAVFNLLKHNPPKNEIDVFAAIYRSLAVCYKKTCDELEKITGKTYNYVYVLGGGARNKFLNDLIAEYTNKKVVAFPIEATSLGNVKIQMKRNGETL